MKKLFAPLETATKKITYHVPMLTHLSTAVTIHQYLFNTNEHYLSRRLQALWDMVRTYIFEYPLQSQKRKPARCSKKHMEGIN